MATYWLWALVLGGAVAVGGAITSRLYSDRRITARFLGVSFGLGLVLAVLIFLLCLPSRFPFSQGNQMGYGVLLGLGASLLAWLLLWLGGRGSHASEIAALASMGGVAVVWVSLTELLFRADPRYALIGGLAGALLSLLPTAWNKDNAKEIEYFALSLLLVGLGSLLAIERYNTGALRPYWVLPSFALAGGLLGVVIGTLLLARTKALAWGMALLAVIVGAAVWLAGSSFLLNIKINPQLNYLLVLGWIAFGLLYVFVIETSGKSSPKIALPLLGVALLIIGFNLGGANGAAIAAAAGLALALPLAVLKYGEWVKPATTWLLSVVVLFLAYRLFLAHFGDEFRGDVRLEFGRHYVFVGLAVALVWSAAIREQYIKWLAVAIYWAALALIPTVLFVVFGHEALLGLILGIWIYQLLTPTLFLTNSWSSSSSTVYLGLIAIWSLIVPNWANFMLEQPRSVRGLIIGIAAVLALLAIGLLRNRKSTGSNTGETPVPPTMVGQ